ncbi:MAG: histidine phosphatase family protein [Pyrinomonadaceae bacterium]
MTVLVFLFAFNALSCNRPQVGSTTVLLVRHAEKASEAEDSPLNEAGIERAQALVRVTEQAGISAIYTSQFKRNRDTAKPPSDRLGVAVTEAPVNLAAPGDSGKTLAGSILEKHAGQVVLVVGHGNTIASIIEGLTGRTFSIGEIGYPDLFIVTIPPSGSANVIKAQYGLKAGN